MSSRYAWPVGASAFLCAAGIIVADPLERGSPGPPACETRPLSSSRHVISESEPGVRRVVVVDLDGDDDNDILAAGYLGDEIVWLESDGNLPPSYTRHVIHDDTDGAQSIAAVDLNGDGDIDVITLQFFGNDVAWLESDGGDPPTFTRHLIDDSAGNPQAVHAIDIDLDGDIDIVVASRNSNTIAWYRSDGNDPPAFERRVIWAGAASVATVFAGDIDGDNDIDVVSAYAGTLDWYDNLGTEPPIFLRRAVSNSVGFATSVTAADMDDDGDVDLVVSSSTGDNIQWYENNGSESFTRRVATGDAEAARFVSTADMDADGNIGLLAGYGGSIAWLRNDGGAPPDFTLSVITNLGGQPQDAVPDDLDGDLDLDIVAADAAGGTIAWYEMFDPTLGTCCLADGTCMDGVCLSDCASMLAWQWLPETTCADIVCPGATTPADIVVDELELDGFKQHVADLAAFETRFWDRPGNDKATAWLADKLASFGYDNVTLDAYLFSGQEKFNVYATKIGTTRPDEMYILGAHFDSFNKNKNYDDAPGADDDASGCASVLEMARVFANVETDVSIRFVLWNNEETGLNGSDAYVENHVNLQGTEGEPRWIAMIQQDMIMFDHGPQNPPDADIEWQASYPADGAAIILAQFVTGAMSRYGDIPAQASDNMRNTDSVSFMRDVTAISVRENTRDEIGNGSNPNWHHPSDRPETYTEQDYLHGFNICKMVCGAIGELVNVRAGNDCPADFDDSDDVGMPDLLALLAAWGNQGGPQDLDESGTVDFGDLLLLLAAWGPCP